MILRKWGHGHSLGSGILIGILLAHNRWIVLLIGLALGYGIAYLRQGIALVKHFLRERSLRKHPPKRGATRPVPVYPLRYKQGDLPEDY